MRQAHRSPNARTGGYGLGWRGRLLLLLLAVAAGAAPLTGPVRAQTRAEFVPTFSTNTRLKQQVERLSTLAEQRQWDEWITLYQQLVDDENHLVVERDEEFLVGVRHHCHELLAALPAEVRARYRERFDADAHRRYQRALADDDPAAMREVYSRYRHTAAAESALRWLANRSLDEGRPEMARVAFERLLRITPPDVNTLLRYALAAHGAGRPEDAAAALERVRRDFGAHEVQVAGVALSGAEAGERVARSLQAAPAPIEGDWHAFSGTDGRRAMAGIVAGQLSTVWDHSLETPHEVPNPRVSGTRGQVVIIGGRSSSAARSRFDHLNFPAVGGGQVWVQGPRSLAALRLEDGQSVWDESDFTVGRDDLPDENPDARLGAEYYRGNRSIQSAPAAEGHLLVARVPLSGSQRGGQSWPADFALAVFDGRTGGQLWRQVAGGIPRGVYYNLPTIHANVVLTGVATFKGGITEYAAVALDAGSGETLWTTYLGAGSDPLGAIDGSPALVRDGVVWIESSLYTLSALDLLTGEIQLIYRYDPARRGYTRGGFDSSPQVTNEPISLIAARSGPIVFAPRWGLDVIALDPGTGRLLWSSPKAPGQSTIGSLFAVDDRHAYVCGHHVQAISLADGAREWTWEPEAGSGTVGFAALAGDRIYIPVENQVHVRSAANGRPIEVLDLSETLGEAPGFGSVLVLGDLLLFATRDRVTAFRSR